MLEDAILRLEALEVDVCLGRGGGGGGGGGGGIDDPREGVGKPNVLISPPSIDICGGVVVRARPGMLS